MDPTCEHHGTSHGLPHRRRSLFRTLSLLLALPLFAACGDDGVVSPPPSTVMEVGVVVNSTDLSVTIFPTDTPEASTTVGLGPDGSPVGLSVREDRAIVPMGTVPAAVIVDLQNQVRLQTVALPEGSGATGSAFLDDTRAVVANPDRNTISVVNLSDGSVGPEIDTGAYPQAVLVGDGRIFVLNAELGEDFQPTRTGTITVLDAEDFSQLGTIELSGHNPGGAAFGADGRLYVLHSGSFGAENGSLSVVDTDGLQELSHHEGFGEFPAPIAVGDDGRIHVASFGYGVAVWDPATESFVRSPEDAITPGGTPSASGIAFDSEGRFYTLTPECQEPTHANRLDPVTFEVELEIAVGTCPFGIAFSEFAE